MMHFYYEYDDILQVFFFLIIILKHFNTLELLCSLLRKGWEFERLDGIKEFGEF